MDESALIFLKQHHPFNLLPSAELEALLPKLRPQTYEAGTLVYEQEVSVLQELSIIVSGTVEKYFQRPDGSQDFTESFGPGDSFGAMSLLLNNQRAIRSVRTSEETMLYQLPGEAFQQLCERHAAFSEHFMHEFGRRMLQSGYAQHLLRKPSPSSTSFEYADQAFTQQVSDLYTPLHQVNTCSAATSIREAAKSMTYYRRGYVLVQSPERIPLGIVTDLDLRNKVVAQGLAVDQPVSEIMSAPLVSIEVDAYSYEAILLMFRRKVNHLLVKEGETWKGMITLDQLLNAQAKSPFIFVQRIHHEYNTANLLEKWGEVPDIVRQLIDRGTRAETVGQIVSAISDAIANNIVRRAIKELGPPPARFVFMALGSEGRKEQTLSTDQDNAIIYEDVEKERREEARDYFLRLGTRVSDELAAAGFAYCDGDLMAKNPKWNHSLSHWKKNYHRWIDEPTPENVVISITFFDCRTVYGDISLLNELRKYIFKRLEKFPDTFFAQLTRASLNHKAPLTFFGNFQLMDHEDRKKVLNIKRAMMPIVDFARIYALKHEISLTNTGERLQQLMRKGVLSEKDYQELHQAYYFMMRLRLAHQSRQVLRGEAPDSLLAPDELTNIEKVTLKEVFKVVEKYQKRLALQFAGMLKT